MQKPIIALVGSNSIHTTRYLKALVPYFNKIIFITHQTDNDINILNTNDSINNVIIYKVNFRLNIISSTQKQIARVLLKHNVQLVHVQQSNSYAYHTFMAIKRFKIRCRTILTIWGSDILILPKKNWLFKQMSKFNLKMADTVTCSSLFIANEIRQLHKTIQDLHVIHFGVQNFPSAPPNLSIKENLILSNRLHKPLYNIDKIIIGFSNFIKNYIKYQDFKLIIAGDGPETNNLIQLANSLGISHNVEFVGQLDYVELIDLYKRSKLYISIPNSDATALSTAEAMAHGCYPILSNIPGNLEWVINQINGLITQNADKLDLDIFTAIGYTEDQDNYNTIIKFNYQMIANKAVFNNNITKFLALY